MQLFIFRDVIFSEKKIKISLTRSNGAAAAFLKKLEASEVAPVNPVKADGWDQML